MSAAPAPIPGNPYFKRWLVSLLEVMPEKDEDGKQPLPKVVDRTEVLAENRADAEAAAMQAFKTRIPNLYPGKTVADFGRVRVRSLLAQYVDLYTTMQKMRVVWSNRADAADLQDDTAAPPTVATPIAAPVRGLADMTWKQKLAVVRKRAKTNGGYETANDKYFDAFASLEAEALRDFETELEHYAVYPWLQSVKGIGPSYAAKLLAEIDIKRADTVSALWRFAGFAVTGDGRRERPTKGVRLPYSKTLKSTCFLIACQFLKTKVSPYRDVYDRVKSRYECQHPDPDPKNCAQCKAAKTDKDVRCRTHWTKGHRHMAALRATAKMFLSHLWVEYRKAEGLTVSQPWVVQHGGHDAAHMIPPGVAAD